MSIESISAVNVQAVSQKREKVTLDSIDMDKTMIFDMYDEDGKATDTMYYTVDKENNARQASYDYDSDGTIDSVSYFKDYESGICQSAELDLNNDGIIDEAYYYDDRA